MPLLLPTRGLVPCLACTGTTEEVGAENFCAKNLGRQIVEFSKSGPVHGSLEMVHAREAAAATVHRTTAEATK